MVSREAHKFVDEVRGLEKNWMLDLGHPLLNRVADSFVKAAGVCTPRLSRSLSITLCIVYDSLFVKILNVFRLSFSCNDIYTDRRDSGRHTGLLLHGRRR